MLTKAQLKKTLLPTVRDGLPITGKFLVLVPLDEVGEPKRTNNSNDYYESGFYMLAEVHSTNNKIRLLNVSQPRLFVLGSEQT